MKPRIPLIGTSATMKSFAPVGAMFMAIFFMASVFIPALAFSDPSTPPADPTEDLRPLVAGNGGAESPNGEGVAKLYFPRVATAKGWQTQIAVVNPADENIEGSLHAFGNNGRLKATRYYSLQAYARMEIAVGKLFSELDPNDIGYLVFESERPGPAGYVKFSMPGKFGAAVPAISEPSQGDMFVSHVASGNGWATGMSLINTNGSRTPFSMETSNGDSFEQELASGQYHGLLFRDLYGGKPQPQISSAVIKNAAGVVGAQFFMMENLLVAVSLTDKTNETIYYPHIAVEGRLGERHRGLQSLREGLRDRSQAYFRRRQGLGNFKGHHRLEKPFRENRIRHEPAGEDRLARGRGPPAPSLASSFSNGRIKWRGSRRSTWRENRGVLAQIERQGSTGIAFVNVGKSPATVTLFAHENSRRESGHPKNRVAVVSKTGENLRPTVRPRHQQGRLSPVRIGRAHRELSGQFLGGWKDAGFVARDVVACRIYRDI